MKPLYFVVILNTAMAQASVSAMVLNGWAGLIADDSVATLEHQIERELFNSTFAAGIINDADTYATFAQAAKHDFPVDPEIDWDEQLVTYVILEEHTNRLRLDSWVPPAAGRATLNFLWDLIEPHYPSAFPALFHAVSRANLAKIDLVVEQDFASDIDLGTLGIPLLGDANNDGMVTGRDLHAVQRNFAAAGPATGLLPGDANDDGTVSGNDLVTVQQRFGDVLFSPSAPVPEPASAVLLIVFIACRRSS